jgi:hypothetical protein
VIESCTIIGNLGSGGGIVFDDPYDEGLILRNSIVYFNSTNSVGDFCDIMINDSSLQSITNSCIGKAVISASYIETETTDFHGVDGCITNDPLFTSASTTNQGTNYPSGDFTLSKESPCINIGANQDWMAATNAVDVDFYPRIMQTIVDMGAYEYAAPTQIVWEVEASLDDCLIFSREGTNLLTIYPESNVFVKAVSVPSVELNGDARTAWPTTTNPPL